MELRGVKVAAGADKFDQLTLWCLERFKQGKGITMQLGGKRAYLMPEKAFIDGAAGLMIAYEGGGCYLHAGKEELNEYLLVSANFPLQAAREITKLVNALITQYGSMRNDVSETAKPKAAQPQLTYDKGAIE